eukprot:m.47519 g.47519  ORF g.47519 m.47519 type:complete len:88 (+) comp12329_c0_seq1:508-771(+)
MVRCYCGLDVDHTRMKQIRIAAATSIRCFYPPLLLLPPLPFPFLIIHEQSVLDRGHERIKTSSPLHRFITSSSLCMPRALLSASMPR